MRDATQITSGRTDLLPEAVYGPIETALTANDRRSILALQAALRDRLGTYSYLEIGSHLGGSLQPFLVDDACSYAVSIDLRPVAQPDERGQPDTYPGNSTKRMLAGLRSAYPSKVPKLVCFERDASGVVAEELPAQPSLCFIDGEHTDAAALRDFRSCMRLAARPCLILFDDIHLIFRGFGEALRALSADAVAHRAYVLPDKIAVIEVGDLGVADDPRVATRLVSPDALLYATTELARYRDAIVTLKRLPGSRFFQLLISMLPFGRTFRPR